MSSGLKEPAFVMPSHSSDINYWKYPDRNFYVFIIISVAFGFLGLDHFYLRSFGTGIQKFWFNIFSLGFWYFWDLIQIFTEGKRVQEEGLTGPFDWLRGIGRGVFENPMGATASSSGGATDEVRQTGGGNTVYAAKRDIFIYSMLTLMFGVFGLDKFYIGEPMQGLAKMLTCFNIFIFLFGWLWVVWDIVKVFLFTDSLMKEGISAPPPFSFMFTEPISAQDLFIPKATSSEELEKASLLGDITNNLKMPKIPPWMSVFAPKLCPPPVPKIEAPIPDVKGILDVVKNPSSLLPSVPELKVPELPPVPEVKVPTVPELKVPTVPELKVPTVPEVKVPTVPTVQMPTVPELKVPTVSTVPTVPTLQKGGAKLESEVMPGPIIAGTLAAVVLAGAAKFLTEVLSQSK